HYTASGLRQTGQSDIGCFARRETGGMEPILSTPPVALSCQEDAGQTCQLASRPAKSDMTPKSVLEAKQVLQLNEIADNLGEEMGRRHHLIAPTVLTGQRIPTLQRAAL